MKIRIVDKSLGMLNNVRIMYPKDGQVYFKIAVIYQMKDQLDKCFEFLSLAIKNGFASEEVMYYKGLAYEAEDDLNKAIYNYNKSLSSNKIDAQILSSFFLMQKIVLHCFKLLYAYILYK